MGRNKRQRLARLEHTIERLDAELKQREAERNERRRRAAWDHLTMVVALVMHGDPRIDEPLEIAWRRALHRLGLNGGPPENLAGELRKVLSDQLPVDVDALKEKFVRVLSSAPLWILSFCRCSLDAAILGIRLKLEGPLPEPGRSEIEYPSWPHLPRGAFGDGGPLEEVEDLSWLDDWGISPKAYDTLDADELIELCNLIEKGEKNWTRLERLRRNEIMAKVRAAHPEMDPRAIAHNNKAKKES